ncbi:hypothetical protein QVD17_16088 [Tagetes erecta]|uniref:Uncharacterized protein n=1 Tax=Tagetes erecta TaxID=13708 RepID=A0AAD8KRC8_TARER|nr:hypothetical protein QVD17_16088 [Tagetes erecta]
MLSAPASSRYQTAVVPTSGTDDQFIICSISNRDKEVAFGTVDIEMFNVIEKVMRRERKSSLCKEADSNSA